MRLRSSTSSCRLASPSRPSMRVMSLLLRNSERSDVSDASCSEEMDATWLPPSCSTCSRGNSSYADTAPPSDCELRAGSVSARNSSGFFSIMRRGLKVHSSPSLLLLSLSTTSCRSSARPLTSTSALPSMLSSCSASNSSPRNTLPTSRTLRPDTSRSLMRSNDRWPSFSSKKSSVSRPLYLALAAACSAPSMGAPSSTLSLRTL
mmetsp:Transcript_11076/g.27223  ORF Transcript_11076/g.27223 Transcript_11076/m.27223 type:complete len:205 (+) Transcript_11076:447-1061(+)